MESDPAAETILQSAHAVSRESPGDVIDRYRLVEVIGEGGMGTVWLAEQSAPLVRRVALKIIKLGMDTNEVVTRFDQERQALALMDHPAIAKVLDAGATLGGRPYFVMDLVAGVPLTAYCDAHRLSVRARLDLMIQICEALQHAHQKGIIHRDLKPSNILVMRGDDGRPQPKVIDFGIAKATGPAVTSLVAMTQVAQIVGTPAYMSPEQAGLASMDIDTRSDIYSLGVVLYELLSGRPPFDPRQLLSAGFDEMRRIIREVTPPRPSTRFSELAEKERTDLASQREATADRMATAVRGDLDWIVMKAMEKDRSRRYETVGALAADLRRHLENRPVLARPPGPAYLISRFVRRHRAAFAAGTAVVAALVAGLTVATWGYVTAASERDKARRARGTAEGLINSMLYDLRDKLQPLGKLELLDDVSRQAERYFEDMPPEDVTAEVLLEKSGMLCNRGSVLEAQGRLVPARDAFAQALAIAVRQVELDPGNKRWQHRLSICHERIGHVAQTAGDLTTARLSSLKAVEISERLALAYPEDTTLLPDVASGWNRVGDVERAAGDLPAARTAFEKALAVVERGAQSGGGDAAQRQLAGSHERLSELAETSGDVPAARTSIEKAVVILERLAQAAPADTSRQIDLATAYYNAGAISHASGDLAAAVEAWTKDLAIIKRLADHDPDNAAWQTQLATSQLRMADAASTGGDHEAAAEIITKVLVIRERLAQSDPTNASARHEWARAYQTASLNAKDRRQPDAAREAAGKALALLEPLHQLEPENTDYLVSLADCHLDIGDLALEGGEIADAGAAYGRCLVLRRQLAEKDPENAFWQRAFAECLERTGDVFLQARDLASARREYKSALDIRERLSARFPDHAEVLGDVVSGWGSLAELAREEGDRAAEREACEKALAVATRLVDVSAENAGWQHNLYFFNFRMSELEEASGNAAKAKLHRQQAMAVLKEMQQKGMPLSPAAQLFFLRESLRGE